MLYQNDGFGKDYLIGLKDGLGADHAGMLIASASYETSEPSVDSQVVTLQGSGADLFSSPRRRNSPPRRSASLSTSAGTRRATLAMSRNSIATVLKPAGLDKSKGLIAGNYGKDANDPRWKDDAGMKQWKEFCDKYMSATEFADGNAAYAFGAAQTMVQVLKQCGGDLSRENIIKQATNLKDLELPMLLPGMKINTSPTNYSPIRQLQLAQFDGASWQLFGDLISG